MTTVTIEQLRELKGATDAAMSRLTQKGANIGDAYVAQGAQMEFKRYCELYVRQLLSTPPDPGEVVSVPRELLERWNRMLLELNRSDDMDGLAVMYSADISDEIEAQLAGPPWAAPKQATDGWL